MSIIDDIIRREGSKYTNHPEDRGGPTKYGITLETLRRATNPYATANDVASLTEQHARAIYADLYVKPFEWIDDEPLRELMVDCAVQHGVNRAVKFLQAAVGATVDGVVGEKTQAAYRFRPRVIVYRRVLAERIKFYGDIITHDPSQAVFAAGWMRRVAEFV
jgi:lysozyme family protein